MNFIMEKLFDKIDKKIKLKDITKKIFMIFMVVQPLLDIYMVLFDEKIQVLGVSIATIFRFSTVMLMTVFVMIYARKEKSTKIIIGYGILVCIYCIFHHINAKRFNVTLNSNAIYNPLQELLFIFRLCIPIALIYIIYNIEIDYSSIKKIVICVVSIISLCIIVTNLFKISYISYSLDNNVIKDNMMAWFNNGKYDYHWKDLTSRGFFKSGNQLSGILVVLLPLLMYIAIKEKKIRYWIVVILQLIAMINISTRVSVIGGVCIFSFMILFSVFDRIIKNIRNIKFNVVIEKIKKQFKNSISLICTVIIIGLFLYVSPFLMRYKTGDMNLDMKSNNETIKNVDKCKDEITNKEIEDKDISNKIEFIESNYASAGIQPIYVFEQYPYKYDFDFWYHVIVNEPYHIKSDNRGIRTLIMRRIYELNNNPFDMLFGESFTRLSSVIWPERDYESHFYDLGICGLVLFIGPYFIILVLGGFNVLKNFRTQFNIKNITYLLSLALILGVGYFSGHVLNELFVLIFISFVAGIVLSNIKKTIE